MYKQKRRGGVYYNIYLRSKNTTLIKSSKLKQFVFFVALPWIKSFVWLYTSKIKRTFIVDYITAV